MVPGRHLGNDRFRLGRGHADLDDWWVRVWSDYVTHYDVDGFRLDVDIYRPDLWSRVRRMPRPRATLLSSLKRRSRA